MLVYEHLKVRSCAWIRDLYWAWAGRVRGDEQPSWAGCAALEAPAPQNVRSLHLIRGRLSTNTQLSIHKHPHLQASGLHSSAATLAKEAGLARSQQQQQQQQPEGAVGTPGGLPSSAIASPVQGASTAQLTPVIGTAAERLGGSGAASTRGGGGDASAGVAGVLGEGEGRAWLEVEVAVRRGLWPGAVCAPWGGRCAASNAALSTSQLFLAVRQATRCA